ncbi:hypothetical protein G8A07_20460 [Roseateles sp. DAIF2]|uniref:hypothetical protein n=1 Tax=Roseateles sp. DAIF2 TaxID=2714952 RepID=UPI0018A2EAA3|nr:hypothetical protein [Roseateles sp. DAIF2]QPF75053.1 hypothetical protein G8A07_20460 [Roseateles sp. DAIF2]
MKRWAMLLVAALSFMAGPVQAGRDWGDEGDYRILHARYGTARHHVDVTERLRELARRDQRVRLGNGLFGVDPDPGRRKSLRIYATGPDGERGIFEYAEYAYLDGGRFSGWRRGDWGGRPSGWRPDWQGGWSDEDDEHKPGPDDGDDAGRYRILKATYGTAQRSVDVSERLRELARGDGRFRVGNALFGQDPDPGQLKTLRITAREPDGDSRVFEYREGEQVDGARFVGWRRGDWGGGIDPTEPARPGRLLIISARYGESGANSVDISERLRERIWRNRLQVRVDNALAGTDPAPGRRKTLSLAYAFEGGEIRHVRIDEQEQLSLP